MYRISQLAQLVGLSRSALLYYEKLGLIQGCRSTNGYRHYSTKDVQQIRLIQRLQAAGLSLKECQSCLRSKMDDTILRERLAHLEQEIAQKQLAREWLLAMLGERSLSGWHQQLNQLAPEAHFEWLQLQGFDEKQALHCQWISKDMNQHDTYMADFMQVFSGLERWGPGSEADTLKALQALPTSSQGSPKNILDIGCGKGFASIALAQNTQAKIIAVDNEATALQALNQRLQDLNLSEQVTTHCASMLELPFAAQTFDLIWSEAAAYIMGVEKALTQWKPLLTEQGCLVFSDLVWLQEDPSAAVKAFFANEYPDMQSVETRLVQIEQAGYQVVMHFSLSAQAWQDYYQPLKARALALQPDMLGSKALVDILHEITLYEQHLGEFGYQMFVLQKSGS